MSESGCAAVVAVCITTLLLFTAGDPDLLDAIINWIARH